MQKMYASEYAKQYEYPRETILRLCREGVLPSEHIGRKYQIYVDEANAVMNQRKYAPKQSPNQMGTKSDTESKKTARTNGFDFLVELKKASHT